MPIVHDPATGRFARSGTSKGKVGGGAKALTTKGKLSYRGVKIEVGSSGGTISAVVPAKKFANGQGARQQVLVEPATAQGLSNLRKRINSTFKSHTEIATRKPTPSLKEFMASQKK